ncbi:hypothetical protein DFH06DRAFT_1426466 [Mycena polygramma]|nr:hypothetical protein DFH06DRAFT_1426466 [Mycena polygramma]
MSILGAPAADDILAYQTPEGYRRLRATYSDEEVANAGPTVARFAQAVSDDAANLIESFKKSTATALFVMAQAWEHCPGPTEPIPGHILLKTFLHHVDGAQVPTLVRVPSENDASERAWASFMGLKEKFVSQFPKNPDFRTRIIAAWPGIFQWCQYFYSQRVLTVQDFDTAQENIEIICAVICHLISDSKLFKVIHETVGIVTLCTQLWMHRATPPRTSYMMQKLLRDSTWEELDEIVAAAGDKPGFIAQLAVTRLRTAMNASSMRPVHVSTFVFTLLTLARLPRHYLTDAILEENACWVATDLLALMTKKQRTAVLEPEYLECINAGFTFLRFALVRDDSPRWVAQAVDAGVLRVICELAPLLEEKLHRFCGGCVRHILRDTLPKHMVYLSVVKLVDRELGEIDEAMTNACVGQTWLRADWRSLLHLTAVRSAVAKLPKSLKGAARIPCESTTCGKVGPKTGLRRCSGCMFAYYCCKQCQKDAWPNHRGYCKAKKLTRVREEGDRYLFTNADVQFFRELFAGSDVYTHLSHLRQLAKRKFPNTKGEHLAICMDYTDPRYPMGTCSLKDIRTYTFPPKDGENEDRACIVAENNELMNMVRRAPKNHTFIEASFAWGERRLSRNFIMRQNIWENAGKSAVNWDGTKMCENDDLPETPSLEQLLGLNGGGA